MRQDLSLPRVVCEYQDVFLDKLPGLSCIGILTSRLSYNLVRRLFL